MVQNVKVDDELSALVKERKPYWATVIALGDRSDVCDNDPFFTQVLSAKIIADIQATACKPNPNEAARAEMLRYNFMKMIDSGARLVLGADTGIRPGNAFGVGRPSRDRALGAIRTHTRAGDRGGDVDARRSARPQGRRNALAKARSADFVVLNANPLENIRNLRQIASVYLHGARLDRDALLTKWRNAGASQSQ